jgi:hypothetical protein
MAEENEEIDEGVEVPEDEPRAGKTTADRQKEIGRDGAYLEVDAADLIRSRRAGDLDLAKMLVLTNARMDLSVSEHVESLKALVEAALADTSEDTAGMDDKQLSFYLFRSIFEAGLAAMSEGLEEDSE